MARYMLRLKAARSTEEDWWDRPVHHACVLSSDMQHHITQINHSGCEGWVATSLWSVIKEKCDIFIKEVCARQQANTVSRAPSGYNV